MKVRYVGSLTNGSVDLAGVTYNFKKDEPITIPDEVGKLLPGSVWEIVEPTKLKHKGGK